MKKFSIIFFITISIYTITDYLFGNLFLSTINKTFVEHQYRVTNEYYDYGFKTNYSTNSAVWGNNYYIFCSDSRGFKFNCEDKEKNNYKYAFIGDSFTEGIGLPFEKTFVGIFKSKINNDVINLGVASYSPAIYYKKIKYFIENGLNFDHLILAIDLTDLEDDWLRLINNEAKQKINKDANFVNKKRIKSFLLDKFPVTFFILRNLTWHYKINFKKNSFSNHLDYKQNKASWSYLESNSLLENKIKNTTENVDKIYQLLQKNKITFSLMVYPHQASILYDKRNSRYYILWKEYCENKCEYFIDAYTGFFDEVNLSSKEDVILKYFIPSDSHFNHAGNIRLAEYINKYIDK